MSAMHFTKKLLLVILLHSLASAAWADSAITARPDDPKAVYLTAADFGAHGDGKSRDSVAG